MAFGLYKSNMDYFSEKKRVAFDFSDYIQKIREEGKIALREMRMGKKESHWIWYFFPQLECLGMSHNSKYYGIKTLEEAEMFLHNEFLRIFFITITNAVRVHLKNGTKVTKIFGYIDDQKFLSCMTLFYYASASLEEKGVDYGCTELFQFCMKCAEKEFKKEDTKTIELCERWFMEAAELKEELESEIIPPIESKTVFQEEMIVASSVELPIVSPTIFQNAFPTSSQEDSEHTEYIE